MTRACLIFGLLFPQIVAAYPQFIGYKYSSCLTCHYNGHGNGPINDYGRALWAAEIAGRLFAGPKSDEELAESSGFLGRTQMPDWIRPGIKARHLIVRSNPGSADASSRSILMQAEANAAIFFDKNQKKTFVASYGFVPEPLRIRQQPNAPKVDEWISREHYFRWQSTESLWLYLGMMDKVYGIRHVNHTAYSRSRTGLAQNDQAHSLIAHYVRPEWELSLDVFMGNLYQDAEYRQKGASTLFEYEVKPNWRLGISALTSTNDFIANQRFGIHSRLGLGFGSSLMLEVGNIVDTPKGRDKRNGYYVFSEAMQKVVRGFHVFVNGQAYKDDMTGDRPDTLKYGLGLMYFPRQRYELRAEIENTRSIFSGARVTDDSWAILMQLHLSL